MAIVHSSGYANRKAILSALEQALDARYQRANKDFKSGKKIPI